MISSFNNLMDQEVNEEQPPIQQQEIVQEQILISIPDLIVKDGGLSGKYTAYLVKGEDKQGKFEAYRRYTDFYELRELLIKKWPGCYIPPIPEKVLASGNDNETVQIRKRLLEIFLTVLSEMPYIYYSEDVCQTFLRSSSNDIAKVFTSQKPTTTIEIIDRMKAAFPNLEVRDQANSEYMLTISTFQGQLRKSQTFLKQYIEQSNIVAQTRKQFQEQKMNLYQGSLPFYEKCILSEYVCGQESKLVISNPEKTQEFGKTLDEIKENNKKFNSIDNLTDMFRYEMKDADSMQQSLIFREQLLIQRAKQEQKMREDQAELAKISAGKQTLTTITNSVFNKAKDTAQVKVEQRIQEGQTEIERLSDLYNVITAIIATKEIDKYRKARVNHYHKFLRLIQQQEKQAYQLENELLDKIIQEAEHQQQQLQ